MARRRYLKKKFGNGGNYYVYPIFTSNRKFNGKLNTYNTFGDALAKGVVKRVMGKACAQIGMALPELLDLINHKRPNLNRKDYSFMIALSQLLDLPMPDYTEINFSIVKERFEIWDEILSERELQNWQLELEYERELNLKRKHIECILATYDIEALELLLNPQQVDLVKSAPMVPPMWGELVKSAPMVTPMWGCV